MADPVTWIAIGGLVIGAAGSAVQASEKNKAIKKSQKASMDATAENQRQVTNASEVQAMKNRNSAAMMKARLRVAGAGAGIGDGTDTLLSQANYDDALNQHILGINTVNEHRKLASNLTADLTNLQGQTMNGILAGLSGGLQGLSTGLQIGSSLPTSGAGTVPPAGSSGGMGQSQEAAYVANPGGYFK